VNSCEIEQTVVQLPVTGFAQTIHNELAVHWHRGTVHRVRAFICKCY